MAFSEEWESAKVSHKRVFALLTPKIQSYEMQGGSGTEPEPETGTVGTVFPETESGTGTAGTVFQEPKPEPEPSFLLNCTEIQKNLFRRGTAGTENRNRSNRSISKP